MYSIDLGLTVSKEGFGNSTGDFFCCLIFIVSVHIMLQVTYVRQCSIQHKYNLEPATLKHI